MINVNVAFTLLQRRNVADFRLSIRDIYCYVKVFQNISLHIDVQILGLFLININGILSTD